MFAVVVNLKVKENMIETFLQGIAINARASLRDEPGCLRFDVHRSADDPSRFLLYEIYEDEEAFFVAHRSAPHYSEWVEIADRCVVPGSQADCGYRPAFPVEWAQN